MKNVSIIILSFLSAFVVEAQPQRKTPQNPSQYSGSQKLQSQNTVTDIDGNVYNTVTIGTQVWMVENLKTTKFRNGDIIPNITDSISWFNLSTGAYCNCLNDVENASTFGRLYNWFAVNDSRNIAPLGWHVPTVEEWKTLTAFVGGEELAGGKLKDTSTTYWQIRNLETNTTGFTALPGGYRDAYGKFDYLRYYGFWWSASEYNPDTKFAQGRQIFVIMSELLKPKGTGMSVRCVKDK